MLIWLSKLLSLLQALFTNVCLCYFIDSDSGYAVIGGKTPRNRDAKRTPIDCTHVETALDDK